MGTQNSAKPSGHYAGRIFATTSKTTNGRVDIFSATVVYVDDHGIEHPTGNDHPHAQSPRSLPWFVRKAVRQNVSEEIRLIATDFQEYLQQTGTHFELAHPDWWAPGIPEQPPYRAEDDQGDLLAA